MQEHSEYSECSEFSENSEDSEFSDYSEYSDYSELYSRNLSYYFEILFAEADDICAVRQCRKVVFKCGVRRYNA